MNHASLHPIHPDLLAAPSTPRVLVIDDVAMNANLIASVISSVCDVQTANSGAAGLQLALQYCPDLILLDILMPDMDGYATLQQLKADARTSHIPVIFLSATTDLSAEELGLNMGAIDFISKPFRAAVLLARVRNHLNMVRQKQLLELLSHSDGLTGIANRRYFTTMLAREFGRMQRHAQPLSVLMVDVDDFKAFNHQYGHLEGDAGLQRIVQTITQHLQRPGDMVARYGGEEFVCLLPDTPLAGATQMAYTLQQAIASLQIPAAGTPPERTLTISVGVASTSEGTMSSSMDLLARADARLYRAKRCGRNRVQSTDL